MKILLDENLPVLLKNDFPAKHQVLTVIEIKWEGKKNGILLKSIVEENFDCFLTIDKNLSKQQNLSQLPLTIFLLHATDNMIETLRPYIKEINKKLNARLRKGLIEIRLP